VILIDAGPSPFGWSRISDFFRCERLYQLKRDRPRENATDGPLARGSTGHVGLAHRYKRLQLVQQGQDPDVYLDPAEAMRTYIEKNKILGSAWQPAVEAVLRHTPIEGTVMHVEEVFGAQVDYGGAAPKRLTSRFDLVMAREGKVWIVDHKTTFKHDPGITDRYRLSGQFLLAGLIGRGTWGAAFGGVYIHALAMIPPYQSALYLLEPTPGAFASFPAAVKEALRRIERCEETGIWLPAFHETVCRTAYALCSEAETCAWKKM
jgi:hypothetical protein